MAIDIPPLDNVLVELAHISDTGPIDPDAPIADLDVDSLDLLEWLYGLEQDSSVELDETLFDDLNGEMTIREIYERIRSALKEASAVA